MGVLDISVIVYKRRRVMLLDGVAMVFPRSLTLYQPVMPRPRVDGLRSHFHLDFALTPH